jgi:uncharacterized membrane protein
LAVAGSTNWWAVRWLRGQLPELIASGAISSENARAIERHYGSADSRSNFGFVLLAIVGSALVGAGVILLIAHNWDELSRATRSAIAFLPLIIAQALGLFVLMRRNDSQAWRESVAILDVAAVATAISLISQTYQIQGTFADFMFVWLVLSIPIVYLFQTTFGAVVYIIGTIVWLVSEVSWRFPKPEQLRFWPLLLLVAPFYYMQVRRGRTSRQTFTLSIVLVIAAIFGINAVAEATRASLGSVAFAGLFAGIYICGITFFQETDSEALSFLGVIGGLGVAITTVILSIQDIWHKTQLFSWQTTLTGVNRSISISILLFFPSAAILLAGWIFARRRRVGFSISAVALPVFAGAAWLIANAGPTTVHSEDTRYSLAAALLFDVYGLVLGVELLARGIRSRSIARANFGLAVIAALAIARFFDSDFTFLTRGFGFVSVGIGFLVANLILFKKKVTT